jgi:outer membrane murein-binding lipoprotein Lpp
MGSERTGREKVGLGCGTLALIALIVLVCGNADNQQRTTQHLDLQSQVRTLSSSVDSLRWTIDSQSQQVQIVSNQLNTLQSQLQPLNAKVDALQRTIDAQNKELQQLREALDEK